MAAVVVGAGGLGGPIALALADAGVPVVIVDDDTVALSNLHRQVQFSRADVGAPKALRLAAACGPGATAVVARFPATALSAADAAVIVDASDDPPTKFAVAAWARARGLPYVIAAAIGYGGNVFVAGPRGACYACLFEAPPDDAPTCGDSGVWGPVVGWIGGVAAEYAIAAITSGVPGSRIWVLDDLRRRDGRELPLAPRPGCVCGAS